MTADVDHAKALVADHRCVDCEVGWRRLARCWCCGKASTVRRGSVLAAVRSLDGGVGGIVT